MNQNKVQEQRLNDLLKAFQEDSDKYKHIQIPEGVDEKRRILRSLMNIRMPKKMADDVIKLQNEYLLECGKEKGIVRLSDIPVIKGNLSIWQGDITRLQVDAVVNAANAGMLGCFIPMHTCIDNCIHTYAGIQLRQECYEQMEQLRLKYGRQYEQPTAVPMLTDAYNLPAKKVIHVVGPIVESQLTPRLEKELADCYRNTLDMCAENGLRSVAFCCISTGVFRFPNKRAAKIAVDTVAEWSLEHPDAMERIIFNVFKDEDKIYYEEFL
ncbi:protein-ADP-ribose hydrolase [Suipraeoptans intestinalis]|uniref:protein-ADP-ribose hydrolase n=1 Tax=Suipraeoptans intestinalis TaxID=2606628 RepID=UPI0023F5693E|nr:protein-ADP-ribose hydrolase [Suipraeoptans intestinalis]MDD7770533.1 protein-ADP-ribose hydrolase [Suipraeoptans intestinalis]MDY3122620.1 protein-ADP-ribose hydrolase [Suipraeoptans intestinalis]